MDTILTEELCHRRTTDFQLEWWRWINHLNLWRLIYKALLLNHRMERSPWELRKIIIGNPLPYIMLMSAKLLPLNQQVTEISILLIPLMWEVNLLMSGPDSPAFGSFLPRWKMYAEGGIKWNLWTEPSDKGHCWSHFCCMCALPF